MEKNYNLDKFLDPKFIISHYLQLIATEERDNKITIFDIDLKKKIFEEEMNNWINSVI